MKLPNNRIHAFALHLVASIAVGLLALALVFRVWYPGELANALGVTEIFMILLFVDICLGPLLTLVVFNLKKPELRRDLLIIFLLQVSALGYGLYTVGAARPAFILFEVDRFTVTLANNLNREKLAEAKYSQFSKIPLFGPMWAATQIPTDSAERNNLVFESTNGGDDLAQIPKYFVPYEDAIDPILDKLKPLEQLRSLNQSKEAETAKLLEEYSANIDEFGFLPMAGESMHLTVIVNKKTGQPKELLNLNPW